MTVRGVGPATVRVGDGDGLASMGASDHAKAVGRFL